MEVETYMELELRQADVQDQQIILNLIKEASGWLRDKGIDQWNDPWPTAEARDRRVYRSLAKGATWIAWDGATAVATITSHRSGRPWLWTAAERRQPAVYLHRLVVSREYAGRGIGADMIDWACRRAAADREARRARIDVWTTNTALHRYYESIGFTKIREAPERERTRKYPSRMLFERLIPESGRVPAEYGEAVRQ